MDIRKLAIGVVTASLLLGIGHSQDMWSGTRAGMTPEEVVGVIPGAYRTTAGPDFKAFDKWPGMSLLAQADQINVLGAGGRAMFGFTSSGLQRIVLTFSTEGMSLSAFDRQCDTFLAALRSRYGSEGSARVEPTRLATSSGVFKNYLWFAGPTEISLSCTSHVSSASPDRPLLMMAIFYHHVGASGL